MTVSRRVVATLLPRDMSMTARKGGAFVDIDFYDHGSLRVRTDFDTARSMVEGEGYVTVNVVMTHHEDES